MKKISCKDILKTVSIDSNEDMEKYKAKKRVKEGSCE